MNKAIASRYGSASLYDVLVGGFIFRGDDPGEIDDVRQHFQVMDEDEKLRRSIVENIKMILQTRRGSITHLPDFGLPDIRQIYFDEGFTDVAIKKICTRIKDTLLKYEPRLEDIRVKVPKDGADKANLRLQLEIHAIMKNPRGMRGLLLTEFSSTGWLKVVFDKENNMPRKR